MFSNAALSSQGSMMTFDRIHAPHRIHYQHFPHSDNLHLDEPRPRPHPSEQYSLASDRDLNGSVSRRFERGGKPSAPAAHTGRRQPLLSDRSGASGRHCSRLRSSRRLLMGRHHPTTKTGREGRKPITLDQSPPSVISQSARRRQSRTNRSSRL